MSRRLVLPVTVVVVALLVVGGLFARSLLQADDLGPDTPSAIAGDAVPSVASDPELRLAVAGDTGTGDAAEKATVDQMLAQEDGRPYDGLVLLGDIVYERGEVADLTTAVTGPFGPIVDTGAVLVPVLGNHDYLSDQQQQILDGLGRTTSWYVQRFGDVEVVVLDTEKIDDPAQTRWLEDTLAAGREGQMLTLVAMHRPAYSAGVHGSNLQIQARWSPLFAEYGVPLVLAGHDHDYQRSKPQDGVTYVVTGAAAKLRPTGSQSFTAVSESVRSYLDLLIYPDHLEGRAIDQSGHLVDRFDLPRPVR